MKIDKNVLVKRILPIIGGALLGYAYYYFIGCSTGSCPISSNPFISTIYGAAIGTVLSFPSRRKVEADGGNN
jgi:hypothetical protein